MKNKIISLVQKGKNYKVGTPDWVCLWFLGVPLLDLGLGLALSSFLLVLLGAGGRAVGHEVAGALAPADLLVRLATGYAHAHEHQLRVICNFLIQSGASLITIIS